MMDWASLLHLWLTVIGSTLEVVVERVSIIESKEVQVLSKVLRTGRE